MTDALDLTVAVYWTLDIIGTFFTGFYSRKGELIRTHKEIALHYLSLGCRAHVLAAQTCEEGVQVLADNMLSWPAKETMVLPRCDDRQCGLDIYVRIARTHGLDVRPCETAHLV